jgi:hypothetical protein
LIILFIYLLIDYFIYICSDYLHDQLVLARAECAAQLLLIKNIAHDVAVAGVERETLVSEPVLHRWNARLDQTITVGADSPNKTYPFNSAYTEFPSQSPSLHFRDRHGRQSLFRAASYHAAVGNVTPAGPFSPLRMNHARGTPRRQATVFDSPPVPPPAPVPVPHLGRAQAGGVAQLLLAAAPAPLPDREGPPRAVQFAPAMAPADAWLLDEPRRAPPMGKPRAAAPAGPGAGRAPAPAAGAASAGGSRPAPVDVIPHDHTYHVNVQAVAQIQNELRQPPARKHPAHPVRPVSAHASHQHAAAAAGAAGAAGAPLTGHRAAWNEESVPHYAAPLNGTVLVQAHVCVFFSLPLWLDDIYMYNTYVLYLFTCLFIY